MGKFILVPSSFSVYRGTLSTRLGQVNLGDFKGTTMAMNVPLMVNSDLHQVHIPPSPVTIENTTSAYSATSYDPMLEYADWYAQDSIRARRSISFDEMRYKVWRRTEISDWIEENCQDTVIACMGSNYLEMMFSVQKDYDAFSYWWMIKRKDFEVVIQFPPDTQHYNFEQQVLQWCKANLIHQYDISRSSRITLYLKDENEAVMAKLFWSDYGN